MTISTIIDTSIMIDVYLPEQFQIAWSARQLRTCFDAGDIAINPIIWLEFASPVRDEANLEGAFSWLTLRREHTHWEAILLGRLAHSQHHLSSSTLDRTLPNFLIGVHTQLDGHWPMTRNAERYHSYFFYSNIIAYDTHH